jgi:hypothetical protein
MSPRVRAVLATRGSTGRPFSNGAALSEEIQLTATENQPVSTAFLTLTGLAEWGEVQLDVYRLCLPFNLLSLQKSYEIGVFRGWSRKEARSTPLGVSTRVRLRVLIRGAHAR